MVKIDWRDYFVYDETSPSCLRWDVYVQMGCNNSGLNAFPGMIAGNFDQSRNYWAVRVDYSRYAAHIVVWEMFNGHVEGVIVDHKDGDVHNNRISNLRVVDTKLNGRNRGMWSTNSSGVTGVCFREKPLSRWVATWNTLTGKQKTKSFSVNKYGYDEAFRLACEFRSNIIEQLNAEGAGYTDRHGKETHNGNV